MNLKRLLEKAAVDWGEKTAVISGGQRISYRELDEASDRLASALARLGLKKGDRAALLLSNSPEFIVITFAVAKLGAVLVPLDPKYRIAELEAILPSCSPRFLIADNAALGTLAPHLSAWEFIERIITLDEPQNDSVIAYRQLMAEGSEGSIPGYRSPEETAIIFYASAPSFEPRGAMLSHRALVEESVILGNAFNQTEKDVLMMYALPMYHVFGMVAVLLNAVAHGSSLVIVPGTGLSIGSFMAAIEEHKGTMFLGVPYVFALAVDLAEKQGITNDLSSLRICCSSGDVLPGETRRRFNRLFGHNILDGLALTESACHVTCMPFDGTEKEGSVGKALPGWEVRTVDDSGSDVPAGVSGEIIVRGPIMTGYFNNPAATAAAIKDGWLYTGDMGRFDEDGVLFYTGRKKEIIILKGQNIYPADIEYILLQHPDIAGAAVFGVPDRMRGEIVATAVQLCPGKTVSEPEIRKFCLEFLAEYKVPKQVIFVDSLPLDAGGSVDKEELRRRLSLPARF